MSSNLESGSAFAAQNLKYANGIFWAGGYAGTDAIGPTAYFTVTKISYGMSMDYTETESRARKTIYFSHRIFDNFQLTLEFPDWQAYQDAAKWFTKFCTDVTDPNNSSIHPMGILVPDPFGFQGVGIPKQGITYGDQVGELVYVLNLSFVGTTDLSDSGVAGSDSGATRFQPGAQDILTGLNNLTGALVGISPDPSLTSLASYYPYMTIAGSAGGPNAAGAGADGLLYDPSPPPPILNIATGISTTPIPSPTWPVLGLPDPTPGSHWEWIGREWVEVPN